MKLVFVDPKCPRPYDSEVLRTQGLGGTEATVIRIAKGLSKQHSVRVLQHNRSDSITENKNLAFLPISAIQDVVQDADHVFFIQKAQFINTVAKNSHARLWLWLHNYLKDEVPFFWQDHLRYRLGIICVSKTHALHTRCHIRNMPGNWASFGLMGRGGLLYHHNPIDDALAPDPAVTRDKHKLVFFSSPYKGIEHVLAFFREAHALDPRLKLYVADPGYIRNFDASDLNLPGIIKLGSLPQHEVLQHVREALCVFYPQYKRPETFGLVYAEANAVGTPVLAHHFGAAEEVLCGSNPPVDATKPGAVIKTLMNWIQTGCPAVQANPLFNMDHVIAQWNNFLTAPALFIGKQKI